jgi:hypothetical protein
MSLRFKLKNTYKQELAKHVTAKKHLRHQNNWMYKQVQGVMQTSKRAPHAITLNL